MHSQTKRRFAFSVIQHAANDPSTLPENEVRSIDNVISHGAALYAAENESFAHHLTATQLADAMIDFTRLTSDDFVKLAHQYVISACYALQNDSPDQVLREFSGQSAEAASNVSNGASPKAKRSDWLDSFQWESLCELRTFLGNALQMDADVLRLNAG